MKIDTVVFAGNKPDEALVNEVLKKGLNVEFLPTCRKAIDELPSIYKHSTNTAILVGQFSDDPDGTAKILKKTDEEIFDGISNSPVVISITNDNSKLDYHHKFDPRDGLADLFMRVNYITKKNPKKISFGSTLTECEEY